MLWPFGIFCGHLVHFSMFWGVAPRQIWQPCSETILNPGKKKFIASTGQASTKNEKVTFC
jgi:hypothetical protein